MKRELDELGLQQLVRGSALLMHEGRMWREQATRLARMALHSGKIRLLAPSAISASIPLSALLQGYAADDRDWELLPADLRNATQLLQRNLPRQQRVLVGQYTTNGGPFAAVLASAVTGLPLLDASWPVGYKPEARGQAHVVVGGNRSHQRYLEWFSRESNPLVSPLLTSTIKAVGGFYTHLQQVADTDSAALQPGGISRAIELGAQLYRAEKKGASAIIDWLQTTAGYRVLGHGQLLPSAMVLGSEAPRRLLQLQGRRQHAAASYWLDEHGLVHDSENRLFGPARWVSAQGELLQADEIWLGEAVSLLVPDATSYLNRLPSAPAVDTALLHHARNWQAAGLAQAS